MIKYRFINIFIIITILSLVISACGSRNIKDDVAYDIGYETEENSLVSYKSLQISQEAAWDETFTDISIKLEDGQIPLALSKDRNEIFYIQLSSEKNIKSQAYIKGDNGGYYSLKKLNIYNDTTTLIKDSVPLITTVKWDNSGNKIAFNGNGKLIIYDNDNNKLVMWDKDSREDSYINYFEWSEDDKRIYTESPTLVNDSIYYVNSGERRESYNNDELIYYKGKLNENYFYASVATPYKANSENNISEVRTAVVTSDGEIVQEITDGTFINENNVFEFRYRDNYKKSLLQAGNIGFGLYYINDIFDWNTIKIITGQFVYEAKFIQDGGFAYTTSNKYKEKNNFLLNIVDSNGDKVKEMVVGSSSFSVSPDGKRIYFDLPEREVVEVENLQFIESDNGIVTDISETDNDYNEIMNTIRGAIDVLYKYILTGEKDKKNLLKYITDTENLYQWAQYDVSKYWEENIVEPNGLSYEIKAKLIDIKKYTLNDNDMVDVNVEVESKDSSGAFSVITSTVSIIKIDEEWYVTGFSTFPNSVEREIVYATVNDYIQNDMLLDSTMTGLEFNQELKGKEVIIGQIQFWQMSEPHLADNVEHSNYTKVYLTVYENGNSEIFKMILEKEGNQWKPLYLDKDNLSKLF